MSLLRRGLGTVVATCILTSGPVPTWAAAESTDSVAGSLAPDSDTMALGGGLSGHLDARGGSLGLGMPLLELPHGTRIAAGQQTVTIGIEYVHDLAESHTDRYGLGAGWQWSGIAFVDSGRRFHTPQGEWNIDESQPTGLAGLPQRNVVFRSIPGTLPRRGEMHPVDYAFTVETPGIREHYNAAGDLVATVDVYGNRVDHVWGDNHTLVAVIDAEGSRTTIESRGESVRVTGPTPASGQAFNAEITTTQGQLSNVITPEGITTVTHNTDGLVEAVDTRSEGIVRMSYRDVPDNTHAIDTLSVRLRETGELLTERQWDTVGNTTASGYPAYANVHDLWASNDPEYRYSTAVRNGSTTRVSEYNARGLLLSERVLRDSNAGTVTEREQYYEYPGTHDSTLVTAGLVPSNYDKAIRQTTVFRNAAGQSRDASVVREFDDSGRMTREQRADGTSATSTFDSIAPLGFELPIGLLLERVISGTDGTTERTVNTSNSDHTAITTSREQTGTSPSNLEFVSETTVEVAPDGFVTESHVTRTPDSPAVTTRYERTPNADAITITEVTAAGTSSEARVMTTRDRATGRVVQTVNAAHGIQTVEYDAAGRTTRERDAAGRATRYEYSPNTAIVTSPDGVIRTTHTDALERTVRVTDNVHNGVPVSGHVRVLSTHTYTPDGKQATTWDVRGNETATHTDVFGRAVETVHPRGSRTLTERDDVHNTETTQTVYGGGSGTTSGERSVTTVRDAAGRASQTREIRADVPTPIVTNVYHDGVGRLTGTTTDALSTRHDLRSDGQPQTTTLTPAGHDTPLVTAERQFDTRGTVVQKQLTNENESRGGFAYTTNGADQTATETDPHGGVVSHTYTVDGLVQETTKHSTGITTRFTHDSLTRTLVKKETITSAGTVLAVTGFEYDPLTDKVVAVFDPTRKAESIIQYRYDADGNLIHTRYPDGKSISRSFDDAGTTVQLIDTEGNTTAYTNDMWGRTETATQTDPDGMLLAKVSYAYDSHDRVSAITHNTGLRIAYTYTSADEIKTETAQGPTGLIREASNDYTPEGYLEAKQETHATLDGEHATEKTTYSYDAPGRLTHSAIHDATGELVQETRYELNVSGDITNETTMTPTATTTRSFTYNALGHLEMVTNNGVSTSQKYDAAGNLTQHAGGAQTLYNHDNQPIADIDSAGATTEYTYWADGKQRTSQNTQPGANETTSYWDGDTLINETHQTEGAEAVAASYLIGTRRHARTATVDGRHNTEHFVSDRHGSTTHLVDRAGKPSTTYRYSDYGHVTISSSHDSLAPNPFQYSGEYTRLDGTQHLGPRHYDPQTARFTTQDTEALHNRYNYGNANPITHVDPSGHNAEPDSPTAWGERNKSIIYNFAGVMAATVAPTATLVYELVKLGTLSSFKFAPYPFTFIAWAATLVRLHDHLATYRGKNSYIPSETDNALDIVANISAGLAVATSVGGLIYRVRRAAAVAGMPVGGPPIAPAPPPAGLPGAGVAGAAAVAPGAPMLPAPATIAGLRRRIGVGGVGVAGIVALSATIGAAVRNGKFSPLDADNDSQSPPPHTTANMINDTLVTER